MTATQTEPKVLQKAEKPAAPVSAPAETSKKPQPPSEPKPQKKAEAKIVLRFTPTAWAKLLYFREFGDTEVGGFGITAKDDLLLVEDFVTVSQKVSVASVSFDDEAVADFFESQVDAGRRPEQFGRIWLHTHPGDSPQPSMVDEGTFGRVFGRCEWAVMFVLARGGKSYARLRFNVGPGGEAVIPIEVDYSREFGPSDREAWKVEYQSNIKPGSWTWSLGETYGASPKNGTFVSLADDWLDAFEEMDTEDRRFVIDELAARPDLWGEESEGAPW
jgi:hypothetical protein